MNPTVNNEEFIGKTVGRRNPPMDSFSLITPLQENLAPIRVRKGVYRFHSHEEADLWLMNHLTRKPES